MRQLLGLIPLFLLIITRPVPVSAEGEFSADYLVTYDLAPTGIANVSQTVTLTNRKSDIYPKQYSIIIDTDNVRSVSAADGNGSIIPDVIQKDGKTQILIAFNRQVVGLGKKSTFTLTYEHEKVAEKNGTIWEVTIPGIADNKDLGDYRVNLRVPDAFGPPAYLSPQPAAGEYWTKEQMLKGGISAAYGISQFFTLDLRYYLTNSSGYSKETEIALPPDTAFQKISIVEIDPKPESMRRDGDNNWLAAYTIPAGRTSEVHAVVRVSISLLPRPDFRQNPVDAAVYTAPTAHWPAQYSEISTLGRQLATPRAIYDYVVTTLGYDYDRVAAGALRKGAAKALSEPARSICTEFTDVFVALARAAGIPARQVIGYAYTTNTRLRPLSLVTDVLHAWPEYYDAERNLWVPIDPTWAATTGGTDYFTKLDFNHIVFAVNGLKDDYPYPAGSYREPGREGKILDIRFTDTDNARHPDAVYEAAITFPKMIAAGLTARGQVLVENISGVSANEVMVTIVTQPGGATETKIISQIPPYSSTIVPFTYRSESYLSNGNGMVLVSVNGFEVSSEFTVRPLHVVGAVTALAGILVIIAIWTAVTHTQSHRKRT